MSPAREMLQKLDVEVHKNTVVPEKVPQMISGRRVAIAILPSPAP